jgi:hypothetical protein
MFKMADNVDMKVLEMADIMDIDIVILKWQTSCIF